MNDLLQILILDDDEIDRMAIRRALRSAGVKLNTFQASSAEDALTALKEGDFACAFVDYNLPRMTGLDFLHQVRQAGITIPIIVLTGQGNEKIAVDLMKAGAADYIPKSEISGKSLSRSMSNAIWIHQAQQDTLRAQRELRDYAQKLESRNKELDAFASMVAHDLKTPLTPIIGMADLIQMKWGETLDPQAIEMLQMITRNGRKMQDIIEALLQLASFRNKEVEPEPVQMAPLIEEVIERLEHLPKAATATIRKPEQWPAAMGHGPWVEEIWANYISNAFKYGGNPPEVELGYDRLADGFIRYWVKDNGRGIEEANKAHLFTAFQRFDKDLAEGHGLGLSIVERIAFKLGGQVGVESEVNKGSIFWFSLPTKKVTSTR